ELRHVEGRHRHRRRRRARHGHRRVPDAVQIRQLRPPRGPAVDARQPRLREVLAMATQTSLRAFVRFALPGIVFAASYGFAACSESLPAGTGDCKPGSGGMAATTTTTASGTGGSATTGSSSSSSSSGMTTEQPPGGTYTSSDDPNNTFDHFNDP